MRFWTVSKGGGRRFIAAIAVAAAAASVLVPAPAGAQSSPGLVLSESKIWVTEGQQAFQPHWSGLWEEFGHNPIERTLKVRLATRPHGTVTVSVSLGDSDHAWLETTELTFDQDTWGRDQYVYVVGGNLDDNYVNDHTRITLDPSGANYGSVASSQIPLTVLDRGKPDTPRWSLFPSRTVASVVWMNRECKADLTVKWKGTVEHQIKYEVEARERRGNPSNGVHANWSDWRRVADGEMRREWSGTRYFQQRGDGYQIRVRIQTAYAGRGVWGDWRTFMWLHRMAPWPLGGPYSNDRVALRRPCNGPIV